MSLFPARDLTMLQGRLSVARDEVERVRKESNDILVDGYLKDASDLMFKAAAELEDCIAEAQRREREREAKRT